VHRNSHDGSQSGNYFLHRSDVDSSGQSGWRWCSRCQGLFFAGGGSLGVCPTGGAHSLQGSGDYALISEQSGTPADPLSQIREGPQGQSWVNVNSSFGIIGQIFFQTDESSLDSQDMDQLDEIIQAYPPKLNVARDPVRFEFYGLADHRHITSHNLALSQKRAEAVRDYLRDRLQHPKFLPVIKGLGEDPESRLFPATSEALSGFRRVDIFAEPIVRTPPPTNPVPPLNRGSSHWQARLFDAISFGVQGVRGPEFDMFKMEIRDAENRLRMFFQYKGPGISAAFHHKFDPPVEMSETTEFILFETRIAIKIQNFEGFARHTAAQLQLGAGPSIDIVHLLGPWHSVGADSVYLGFGEALGDFGNNFGASIGTSVGTFEPKGRPTSF
jgi:outer membrane protein OmpA-like peptidoglycan-associated protein